MVFTIVFYVNYLCILYFHCNNLQSEPSQRQIFENAIWVYFVSMVNLTVLWVVLKNIYWQELTDLTSLTKSWAFILGLGLVCILVTLMLMHAHRIGVDAWSSHWCWCIPNIGCEQIDKIKCNSVDGNHDLLSMKPNTHHSCERHLYLNATIT